MSDLHDNLVSLENTDGTTAADESSTALALVLTLDLIEHSITSMSPKDADIVEYIRKLADTLCNKAIKLVEQLVLHEENTDTAPTDIDIEIRLQILQQGIDPLSVRHLQIGWNNSSITWLCFVCALIEL